MRRGLDKLAFAISEIGEWTWWAAKFPYAVQLEFDNALLYFGQRTAPLAPSSKIALVFYKPISFSFIQKGIVEKDWAMKLSADCINHFDMTAQQCGFNQALLFRKLLKQTFRIETAFGAKPQSEAFRAARIQFGFWAGNVGVLLAAESFRIFNLNGELALEQVSKYEEDWWSFRNEKLVQSHSITSKDYVELSY